MTHNEKRASPWREAQLALFTGGLFGATHTTTGKIWREEGVRGFFRGMVPPLWGSSVYRAVMLSAYEFAFTYCSKNFEPEHVINQEFGYLRPVVLCSAFFASTCRTGIENPIEYAKVMGQTGKAWVLKDIYRGTQAQIIRNTGLLLPIFAMVDISRRHTDLMKNPMGIFGVTCGSASAGYLLAWPLETLKNLAQTATPHAGATVAQRINYLGGLRGLYRGVVPGTICGGFRNGCAMMIMNYAQQWATALGLRDE